MTCMRLFENHDHACSDVLVNSLHSECVVSLKVLTLSHKEPSYDWVIVDKSFSLLSSNFPMEPTGEIFIFINIYIYM